MNNDNQLQVSPPPKKRGRKFQLWLGGIVAGLVVLILIGAVYESTSEAADQRAYPPPGQMVDIGGYRLHLDCTGTGSPTVVVEAGLGDWSAAWESVQTEVAKTTRVCTYDRAGMGWSEAGPLPRDAGEFANELYSLLQKANLTGPYVLVGHSLGGLSVRVFAAQHPSEVAGIVLIDSMFPGQGGASITEPKAPAPNPSHTFSPLTILARFGVIRGLAELTSLGAEMSPAEQASLGLGVTPKYLQASMDEFAGVPESMSQANAVKSLGDIPLIVLSRGRDQTPDWRVGQAGIVKLSTASQQLFAQQSGHNIEMDQPQAAVEAIVKMVQIIRQRQE